MPKERPIIFSGPLVRAILEGRKTQTRRVVDQKTPNNAAGEPHLPFCPYGQPGDRLWVREPWARSEAETGDELMIYQADLAVADVYQFGDGPRSLNGFRDEKWTDRNGRLQFRRSIHMPRWASRITLEVTDVRVERLQEITEADAQAEGVEIDVFDQTIGARNYSRPGAWFIAWNTLTEEEGRCDLDVLCRTSYRTLWDKLNANRGYSWEQNPWVWVVSVKRVEQKTVIKEQS